MELKRKTGSVLLRLTPIWPSQPLLSLLPLRHRVLHFCLLYFQFQVCAQGLILDLLRK
jgi:hypothetical protein